AVRLSRSVREGRHRAQEVRRRRAAPDALRIAHRPQGARALLAGGGRLARRDPAEEMTAPPPLSHGPPALARLGAGAATPAEAAHALFTHSVPPRLARVGNRSADYAVLRLAGLRAIAIAETARLPVPTAPGRVISIELDGASVDVARASEGAPFVLQLTVPREATSGIQERLERAGARGGTPAALELARVRAGWPGLVSEVDEKTIPQEVRFDEI